MSDLTLPSPRAEAQELAQSNRRLTTAILGLVLLTGLIACMSYLAGRTVTQMKMETVRPTQTVINPPPLVIEPKTKAAPVVVAAAPAAPTQLYWQVGIVKPEESHIQDLLQVRGYAFKLAPFEDTRNFRVLVGPVTNPQEQATLDARLTSDGLQHFLRRN
ncbi:MAG: hypothetical protein FJW32_12390 [Acidobacteria bacterium]|nr:hypothetical protein [Acidobacteriota bacterium]